MFYHVQYRIFERRTVYKPPETSFSNYMWGTIPTSRLQSPFQEDSPVNHPMAGSDVFKLLWGINLSPNMSQAECTQLIHKLSKIKRLEDGCVNLFIVRSYYDVFLFFLPYLDLVITVSLLKLHQKN